TDQGDAVLGVAFLKDERSLVASYNSGRIALLDIDDGKKKAEIQLPGKIFRTALAPRAQYLAVGSNDGRLRILSVPELKLFHESTDRHEGVIHAVAFSADGNLLVTGGRDRRVAIWQVPSFKTILLLPRTNSSVLHVAFSPQGRLL